MGDTNLNIRKQAVCVFLCVCRHKCVQGDSRRRMSRVRVSLRRDEAEARWSDTFIHFAYRENITYCSAVCLFSCCVYAVDASVLYAVPYRCTNVQSEQLLGKRQI